jgi:prepilin-type N-terminal cleavage/methylation domain-containing protein
MFRDMIEAEVIESGKKGKAASMKSGPSFQAGKSGFTLLEIIVTILVASVLAALMVQFMNTAMIRGGDPAAAVRAEADTGAILEQIVSDYVQQINSANPENALANLKTSYASNSNVTMTYISFDASGQEVLEDPTPTDSLKVIVKKGGYAVTTLLTNTRVKTDDPVSKY